MQTILLAFICIYLRLFGFAWPGLGLLGPGLDWFSLGDGEEIGLPCTKLLFYAFRPNGLTDWMRQSRWGSAQTPSPAPSDAMLKSGFLASAPPRVAATRRSSRGRP
jgi:hypothetical protein